MNGDDSLVYCYYWIFAVRHVELSKSRRVDVDRRATLSAAAGTRGSVVVARDDVAVLALRQTGLQVLVQAELFVVNHDESAITSTERYRLRSNT